ncbi:MAG: glycosyltransferase family 2 protein [Bacteroidota bacterium]
MKKNNLAGIVLYNPDISRLKDNIDAIIGQVDQLILIENGSKNTSYLSVLNSQDKIVVVMNDENKGIAGALNQILAFASENGYDWALTLDQDSVVSNDIISVYSRYTKENDVGMLACDIVDRNFHFSVRREHAGNVDFCISSGSYVRVEAWRQIHGFDESMFIDSVDLDFCLTLRKRNWRIFRTLDTHILHEVGNSKVVKILGKEYLALNHSLIRYYYIVRNHVYVGRKHNRLFKSFKITTRLFYTVLFFEKQRTKKLTKMIQGFTEGLICKINTNG